MASVPSPAVAFVGRHQSGKTTLIEKVIAGLAARGLDVGSIKHHSHAGFEIDYEGKDSFRHRQAGATDTIIAAPGKVARVKAIEEEAECDALVAAMPGHDIVIVEGYRKSGLPTIEVMRSGNEADRAVARWLAETAQQGGSLNADSAQLGKLGSESGKAPTAATVAFATDIDEVHEAARHLGIPSFSLNDADGIVSFIVERYVRKRITVVIQAGGESKRMGRSKATVPFLGRPLICRLIERLGPVADELIVTTNEPENLGFLEDEFPQLSIRLVRDRFDVRGSLPGLCTALEAASHPFVAVIACDMVFASPSIVVSEALCMVEEDADVVVPVNKHGFEPFHSLYRRDACLPVALRLYEQGEKRVRLLFDDESLNVRLFSRSEIMGYGPTMRAFINANTAEELARLEEELSLG